MSNICIKLNINDLEKYLLDSVKSTTKQNDNKLTMN